MDWIYKLWLIKRPKITFYIEDLHIYYKIPKDKYVVLTKESYLKLIRETRQIGMLEQALLDNKVIPYSLKDDVEVIQEMWRQVNVD